jgi:leader peptidase (prepilin peptidase)/N-methyltransferase
MPELLVAVVFGSLIGSFLNVLIVRLPRDQSILFPRSHCPKCGRAIAWYDNIPILSWVLLGGRCRHCGKGISVQYPLIEAAVAAIWGAAVWYYGASLLGLTAAIFATLLLGIAVTDARHYLIPDEYTWGGLALGLVLAWRNGLPGFWQAMLGAGVGFTLLYAIAWAGERVFKEEAMGGGDIKMMAMVGAYLGWQGVLLTLFGGALLGSLVFVPLSLKRRRLVPFGVFLAAAAALSFVWKDAIIAWYATLLSAAR